MNVHKQMEDLYTEVSRLLTRSEFEVVNQLLRDFAPEKHKPIVGVGLLRITFLFRHEISEWEPLLGRVRKWLEQSNKDADRLLRGLDK